VDVNCLLEIGISRTYNGRLCNHGMVSREQTRSAAKYVCWLLNSGNVPITLSWASQGSPAAAAAHQPLPSPTVTPTLGPVIQQPKGIRQAQQGPSKSLGSTPTGRASQVVLVVKNSPANTGDTGDADSVPGSGRSPWRRAGQHTPIFLPGESHGQGYGPWGSKESDRTEVT